MDTERHPCLDAVLRYLDDRPGSRAPASLRTIDVPLNSETGILAGQSALLLTFYTAGLSLPFLIAGAALGRITPMFKKINRYLPAITVASGVLMVGVGILVYQNLVVRLNEYFDFLPYVNFSG